MAKTRRTSFVTGAAGFSGSWLIRELLDAGDHVVASDRETSIGEGRHAALLDVAGVPMEHPRLEWSPADLLDVASLQKALPAHVDRVFHVASLYDYSAPIERLREINVEGTRHLLAALRDHTLQRFVHWSTCGVFGKPYTAADGSQVNVPFTESSSSPRTAPSSERGPEGTHLVNAYSISKWEQERMIWEAARDGLPVNVVRPAPIYGPGSDYGHGGIALAIAHGLLPVIPADSKNYITASVHVRDIARFAVHVADRDDLIGEDYNIVDNSIISYREFLHYIALLCGRRIRDIPLVRMRHLRHLVLGAAHAANYLERRWGMPRPQMLEVQSATYMASSYWLSNRKSMDTGFEYMYPDVREGLKDTVTWMREQGWLTDGDRLKHTAK